MNTNLSASDNLMLNLLLVDDDRLVLTSLSRGLTRAGYRVNTAESANEAETILMNGERPDLVILDVYMPGKNGLELAERLSTLDCIPFILLTAYNDTEIVEQAATSGALSYLIKPIDTPQLIPVIKAALARAKDLKALHDNGNQLQAALAAERDISIAVGITMVQYRIDRRAAFEMLRKTARDRRQRLAELAHTIINASEMLNLANKPKNNGL